MKMMNSCEKGFCGDCQRRGCASVFSEGSVWHNRLAHGCKDCPMNCSSVASQVNWQLRYKNFNPNEIQVLAIANSRTKMSPTFPSSISFIRVIKDNPHGTPEFFRNVSLRILHCNHKAWFESVEPSLQNQCMPLVLVTRPGFITATIARCVLLMLGNSLIIPYEVFDKLLYNECFNERFRM